MNSIIYINSLGLSVCDRAWEGAGWARTGHGHGQDWARSRVGLGMGLGTSMVTGRIGHGRAWHGRVGHGRVGSERHRYPLIIFNSLSYLLIHG